MKHDIFLVDIFPWLPWFPHPSQKPKRQGGRHFLDEEAELSDEEGAVLSSDEEDGEDLNRSLEGFVVDNSHVSQGLNG